MIKSKKMATIAKRQQDYSSPVKLQAIIDKWRNILGIDPIYIINLKIGITEDPDLVANPAWIEGLDSNNKHPMVSICLNAMWLENNKYDELEINTTVIHELIHIPVWEALITADPNYKYVGLGARANEVLTMKMTSAIIKIWSEKKD